MIIVQNWKFIVLKLLANQFIEHLILSLGFPLPAEANVIQKLLFGDMVPTCNKVNYKLNYKPGTILCPRTKNPVLYDNVKDQIEMLS